MSTVVREALRTIQLSLADLEPEPAFRVSFPDVGLPSVGARPLSITDIGPIQRASPPEVEARQMDPFDARSAKPRASRGPAALVLALLVFPSFGAVGGWLASGNAQVEDAVTRITRLATSATASMAKSLEGPTAAGVFE